MNELMEKRLEICKSCLLYKEGPFGPTCDNEKYMNFENKISYLPKPGYIRGCGCLIRQKAMKQNSKCPLKKW